MSSELTGRDHENIGRDVSTISGVARHWSVTVEIDGVQVLSIGWDWLSGVSDVSRHAPTIRHCADHLRAFIGED